MHSSGESPRAGRIRHTPQTLRGAASSLGLDRLGPGPLEERYIDSPYRALVRGQATAEYRQLEDSLGAFAAGWLPCPRAPMASHARPA